MSKFSAYAEAYKGLPVFHFYRRNIKGQEVFMPRPRMFCISKDGKYNVNHACPICRDEYLFFDFRVSFFCLQHFRSQRRFGKILKHNCLLKSLRTFAKFRSTCCSWYYQRTQITIRHFPIGCHFFLPSSWNWWFWAYFHYFHFLSLRWPWCFLSFSREPFKNLLSSLGCQSSSYSLAMLILHISLSSLSNLRKHFPCFYEHAARAIQHKGSFRKREIWFKKGAISKLEHRLAPPPTLFFEVERQIGAL